MLVVYLCLLSLAAGMQSFLPEKKNTSVGDESLGYVDVNPNDFINFDDIDDEVSPEVEARLAKCSPADLPSAIGIFRKLRSMFLQDHYPAIKKLRSYISKELKVTIMPKELLFGRLVGLDLTLAFAHMQEQLLESICLRLCAPKCCHLYEISALFVWRRNMMRIVSMIDVFPVENMVLDGKELLKLFLNVTQSARRILLLCWQFTTAFKKAITLADRSYFPKAPGSHETLLSLSLVYQEQSMLRIYTSPDGPRDMENVRNQIDKYMGALGSQYCSRIKAAIREFDKFKAGSSPAVEELFSELDKNPREDAPTFLSRAISGPVELKEPGKSGTKASRKRKRLPAEVKAVQTEAIEEKEEAAELDRPVDCPKHSEEASDEAGSEQKEAQNAEHSYEGDLDTKNEVGDSVYYYEAEEKEEGGSNREEGEGNEEGSGNQEKADDGAPLRYSASVVRVAKFLVGTTNRVSVKDMQMFVKSKIFGIDVKDPTGNIKIKVGTTMMHSHKVHREKQGARVELDSRGKKQLRKLGDALKNTEAWKHVLEAAEHCL